MRIIFMGTPDFAVPTLRRLIEDGHNVTLVVTQSDKPVGRKQILTPPPVKELALSAGISVYQPPTLKSEEALARLASEKPDVIVVAAYGKILPKAVLELPRFGCVNVHASLLPRYRGAAPIQWAVLRGDAETGVTTMQMAEGLDTGDILLTSRRAIPHDMTAGELFDLLAEDGASLLSETLKRLEAGTLTPTPQMGESCYASMLSKADSEIDWMRPAEALHNQVRGLYPWPVAACMWRGKRLKIHRARDVDPADACQGKSLVTNLKPGHLACAEPLCVACGDGRWLQLLEVQPEGGRVQSAADFWRGHALPLGTPIA